MHPLVAWALSDRAAPLSGVTGTALLDADSSAGGDSAGSTAEGPVGWPGRTEPDGGPGEGSGLGWPGAPESRGAPGSPLARALAADLATAPGVQADRITVQGTTGEPGTGTPSSGAPTPSAPARRGWRKLFGGGGDSSAA